jgi:membrane protein
MLLFSRGLPVGKRPARPILHMESENVARIFRSFWRGINRVWILRLPIQAGISWYEDNPFQLGAALAYYAVFSISPIIVLTVAVASMFFGPGAAEGRITEQISYAVGPTVAGAIQDTLRYTYQSGSNAWATVVSVVILLFGATGFFNQLQSGLNAIWRVRPKPGRGIWGTLRGRVFSFLAVLGVLAMILASLLVNTAMMAVAGLLPAADASLAIHLWRNLALAGSFVFLALAFAILFRYLPDVKVAWHNVWIGAALSALLFMLGNYLIGLYLERSGTRSAYGAAGSFVVVLLWVYYSAQAFLFGVEFTRVYAIESGNNIEPRSNAELIAN